MKTLKKLFILILVMIVSGLLIPQNLKMPVQGASHTDYNPNSFWFYPWGKSGTHKGVDIFAAKGTPVKSSTNGFVIYTGKVGFGGNIVLVLGPKWRYHYYAHLDDIKAKPFTFVNNQSMIGTVGNTGNAAGKPAHLHYSIKTLIPYLWRIDNSPHGWKKMFYLNPIQYF